ncbi:serine/threonine-protein kinase/endoribonuclease IRE2-like isoform X1 [Bolinopsis microptera]|uniref:serine/threonine-protein kinase/endoribonuclease IRE2-like isoform X1 n=1 Tax=Bolinopsis microptera TaxID=2820187 RepID=UPI0030790AD5
MSRRSWEGQMAMRGRLEWEDLGGSDERTSRDEASVRQKSTSLPTITKNFTVDQYRNEVKLRNCLNLEKQITKRLGIGNRARSVAFKEVGERKFLRLDKNVLLGSGSNGTRVYLGTFRQSVTNDEKLVAIKRTQYDTEAEYKATYREIENLQRLDHYNLIKYLCADKVDEYNLMFIALELCEGSLINVFELRKDVFERPFILRNKAPPDDWRFKKHLLLGVANGLNYIHQEGHVHRDLKPQNILVQVDDSNEFGYKAVICDFELTRELKLGKTKLSVSSGIVGTHGWMAKEVLNKGDQTKALDIFAYGCIIQFVMSESRAKDITHPFGPDIQRDSAIMEGKRYSYISTHIADNEGYVHPDGQSASSSKRNWVGYRYLGDALLADMLVGVCISENINVRPSAAEIIKHPFYWSYEQRMQCNERMFNAFKDNFQQEDAISVMESNWKALDTHPLSLLVPAAWDYYLMHRRISGRKGPSVKLSASIFNCLMRTIRNIQQHYEDAIGILPDLDEVMDGSNESMGQYFFEGVPLSFPVIYITYQWLQLQSNRSHKEKLDIYDVQIETLFAIKKDHYSL